MSYLPSKASLRRQCGHLISALGAESRARADSAICESICALPEFSVARQVVGYLALGDEAALSEALERADAAGKRLYLPAVVEGGELEFRLWRPGEPLRDGGSGVREPRPGSGPVAEATLTLVPGRAFDVRGNRVGRGGGHYDRALARLARLGPTVGVAYACQVFSSVPREPHDVPVDLVVSEEQVRRRRWPGARSGDVDDRGGGDG